MLAGFWIYSFILFITIVIGNPKLKSEYAHINTLPNPILFTNEYFPDNKSKTLIYDSDFGETKLNVVQENGYDIYTFKSDDFTYRQKLLINENGVFVKETYQKMKLFLFINKEGTFTYNELLPRIKFPLTPGNSWNWEGKEFEDDEINTITLNASVETYEKIKVPAGTFDAVKLITTVTSSSGSDNIVTEWFAKDIGLIKMSAVIKGSGLIGTVRDLLGLGKIEFELMEIKSR
ncbi:MAG: hypothetical protein WAV89_02125 [Ignavibacteriaceae bacterium]